MMKSIILRERLRKLPIKESHKIVKLKGTLKINELNTGIGKLSGFSLDHRAPGYKSERGFLV